MHTFDKSVGAYKISVILAITVAGLEGNATRAMVFRPSVSEAQRKRNVQQAILGLGCNEKVCIVIKHANASRVFISPCRHDTPTNERDPTGSQ